MFLIPLRFARGFPLIVAVTLACFVGACASTTVIDSRPTGARLYLDNAAVGNTPYTYSDSKIVSSTTHLRIEAPGYQTYNGVLVRNEELEVLALVAGIFLLVPLLWVMKYQPAHVYELQPAQAGYPGAPAAYGYPPGAPEAYPPPAQGYPPPPPAQGYPPPPAQGYPPPPAQGYPPPPPQGYPPPPPR